MSNDSKAHWHSQVIVMLLAAFNCSNEWSLYLLQSFA